MPPKKMKTVNPKTLNMLKSRVNMPIIFAYVISVVLIYNTYGSGLALFTSTLSTANSLISIV